MAPEVAAIIRKGGIAKNKAAFLWEPNQPSPQHSPAMVSGTERMLWGLYYNAGFHSSNDGF